MNDYSDLLRHTRGSSGFSVTELMVALVLGAMVVAGVLEIFMGSKRIYRAQEEMARLQENGRFAADFIARGVRMAGFMGCASALSEDNMVNTLKNNDEFLYDFAVALVGFEANDDGSWSPTLDSTIADLSTPPTAGTDVLSLRRIDGDLDLPVTPPFMANTFDDLRTIPNNLVNQFDIVIVADCEASAVFQISNSNPGELGNIVRNTGVGTPGNATKNLGKIFTGDAELMVPVVESFYIAPGASGRPSLWKLTNSRPVGGNNPQELVEGIENLQVLYGEDADGDETADRFVTADAVTDWNDVVSVRLSLLAQTLGDNVALETQEYVYNGATVTAGDRRLRRVFTATVSLRNRIP